MAEKQFVIEQTYENFVTGEKWTRVYPKVYKTWRGAENTASQKLRWVTRPNRDTLIDSSSAVVIERASAGAA